MHKGKTVKQMEVRRLRSDECYFKYAVSFSVPVGDHAEDHAPLQTMSPEEEEEEDLAEIQEGLHYTIQVWSTDPS